MATTTKPRTWSTQVLNHGCTQNSQFVLSGLFKRCYRRRRVDSNLVTPTKWQGTVVLAYLLRSPNILKMGIAKHTVSFWRFRRHSCFQTKAPTAYPLYNQIR